MAIEGVAFRTKKWRSSAVVGHFEGVKKGYPLGRHLSSDVQRTTRTRSRSTLSMCSRLPTPVVLRSRKGSWILMLGHEGTVTMRGSSCIK